MSKLKILTIAVIGLLVLNLCIVGFLFLRLSAKPQGPPPFVGDEPKNKIAKLLQFDHTQVLEYEKLIDQHKNTIRLLNDRIRITKSSLYNILVEEDSIKKDSLINKLGELQVEVENTHYNHFSEIKILCKPEQLDRFNMLTGELADFFGSTKEGARPMRERP